MNPEMHSSIWTTSMQQMLADMYVDNGLANAAAS